MWKILTAASTAVALLGTPALADWATWDTNADAMLDENEFGTGFREGGLYNTWDADQDAMLTEDEWRTGFGDRYDETRYGVFSDWDANQDTFLDEDEYDRGLFSAYDADDDSIWSEDEYGAYEDDDWF